MKTSANSYKQNNSAINRQRAAPHKRLYKYLIWHFGKGQRLSNKLGESLFKRISFFRVTNIFVNLQFVLCYVESPCKSAKLFMGEAIFFISKKLNICIELVNN